MVFPGNINDSLEIGALKSPGGAAARLEGSSPGWTPGVVHILEASVPLTRVGLPVTRYVYYARYSEEPSVRLAIPLWGDLGRRIWIDAAARLNFAQTQEKRKDTTKYGI